MTKTHINVVIDVEIYELLKAQKVNISNQINEHLKKALKIEPTGKPLEQQITEIETEKLTLDKKIIFLREQIKEKKEKEQEELLKKYGV